MKFLDSTGLSVLWNKIKSSFLSLDGGGEIKSSDKDEGYSIIIGPNNGSSNKKSNVGIYGSIKSTGMLSALMVRDDAAQLSLSRDQSIYDDIELHHLSIDMREDNVENIIQYNNEPYVQSISTEELNEVLV